MMSVLLVEDDRTLSDGVAHALNRAGFTVRSALDGAQADAAITAAPSDVVVLDLGLPDMDGLDLLGQWRRRRLHMPVLVLTARDALADRVHGLNVGADDYIAKPFAIEELVARLLALRRRARLSSSGERRHGPLRVDTEASRAWLDEQPLDLPGREWAILNVLLSNVDKVVSKEQIVEAICSPADDMSTNAVEVYMSRLRTRLETAGIRIRTIRGFGYMLEPWHQG